MKRIVSFFIVVLLISSAVFFLGSRTGDTDLLDLVPGESLLVVDWDSPAQSYFDFIHTPLGEGLQKMDWPLILNALGLTAEKKKKVEDFSTAWKEFSESLFFKDFFDVRSVFALLATHDDAPENSIVLLSKTGRKIALFHSLLAGMTGMEALPVRKYQGYTINGYVLNSGVSVYFTTDQDILIVALNPAPVKKCLDLLLDRILQKGGSLADNTTYKELKRRARGLDDFFLYVNIASLNKRFLKPTILAGGADSAPLSTVQTMKQGLQQAVLYHQPLDRIHQFTSIVRFDDSDLPSFQKHIYQRPPVENRKLRDMPANLLVYFWSNWLELPAWWRATQAGVYGDDVERADRLAGLISEFTGMSIEDFLALFGHQVGLNIKEIRTSGFFPTPRICFCVEMTDRKQIHKLLEQFIVDLPYSRDNIAGVEVVSVLAAGGLMQPSYALLDDYLIVADGRDQIEDILQPKGEMLIRDADFIELDMGLQQPNNLVLFSRSARLIDGLKELASWLGTIIAIRDVQVGDRSKVLVDQAIIPFLDSLTMFKAKALRGYTAAGELILQSTVLVEATGEKK